MPSRTRICPITMASRVTVPVLSKTSVSTFDRVSSACKLRTMVPLRASAPAAANMAAGVASDRAHGHVTTKTATATIKACPGSRLHHHAHDAAAASSTPMRNGLARRSAIMATCGLELDALSIKATIWANRVSAPTRSSLTRTVEFRLWLPATTISPGLRASGRDSPVNSASSTMVVPDSITPSAAKDSPGCTRTTSPAKSLRTATRSKVPSGLRRSMLSGKRFIRASIAPAVRSRKRNSSQRPVSRKNTNMVRESKYTSRPKMPRGSNVPTVLMAKVIPIPKATGRSMLIWPCRMSRKALRKNGPQEKSMTGRVSTQEAHRNSVSISVVRSPGCAI